MHLFAKKHIITKDVIGLHLGISMNLFVAEVVHLELMQTKFGH